MEEGAVEPIPKYKSLVARRRAIFENGCRESISHEEIKEGKLEILTNAERKKMKEQRFREYCDFQKGNK